ncbi:MAG: histidine kinase, partial [Bacteroidaceae bacterium]|nr:histidine kinase [Bacteroidaceae bacterium]
PTIGEDTRQQFILRTHSQAQRLTALLQDISTLNKMDYAPEMLRSERVDIAVLFADIVQETALAMQQRRMTLLNYLPQDIIVQGNPSLLYSIFRNLVDNAIAHAGPFTTIEVRANREGQFWHFQLKDNGIGIPQQHLKRIFERFYRIDKGRSRAMGGTGLGLSIVKNAVLLHGGTITASSPQTGGATFDFTIRT